MKKAPMKDEGSQCGGCAWENQLPPAREAVPDSLGLYLNIASYCMLLSASGS